jgi:hypothetical protein
MNKLLILTCVIIAIASKSYGAGLGGTVYVPNLHAKCLSTHQKCILECASDPESTCTNESINEKAKTCAEACIEEYVACEELLDKLKCMNSYVPVKPRNTKVDVEAIFKRIEEENKHYEDG